MDDASFEEFKQSIIEAKKIMRGEAQPSRVFHVNSDSVKGIRERIGLSQRELAAMMRVSIRTLQGWEQGRRRPTGPAAALIRIFERVPQQAIEALRT